MNNVAVTNLNSKSELQARAVSGKLTWQGPLVVLVARFALAWLVYGIVGLLFNALGVADAWATAASWWVVYGTLIDIGCLAVIIYFLRREGIRLLDLLSWNGRLGRTVLVSAGLTILFLVVAIGSGGLTTGLLYGAQGAPPIVRGLPMWAVIYSIVVWPLIWGFAEEMTYTGYTLPRLQVLLGKTWLAVVLVTIFWSLQHIALPVTGDLRFWLYRIIPSAVTAVFACLVYLRTRSLVPLIVAHWLSDLLAAVSFSLMGTQ